jgi:dTDP-4-dehydrorhamnose reductase
VKTDINVLILGATGQVGTELTHQAWPSHINVYAPNRGDLDFANEEALHEIITSRRWACVINTAAYTAVDNAEAEVGSAWRINALAPALLAAGTAKSQTPIIHVSTDYVFDGKSEKPYRPEDPMHPKSVYGASKAGGEYAVGTANPRHVIVRSAWIFSPHRSNFVKTMLRLATERDVLRVVDDQVGCPTSAADLASALMSISRRLIDDPSAPYGTYHFANAGETTWCGLARQVMGGAQRRGARTVPVEAITTADFVTKAVRPANSALATDSLTRDYAIRPRPWQHALEDVLDALLCSPKLPGRAK